MTTEFRNYADGVADEIIELSRILGDELETWNDVQVRVPGSTSKDVSAGFVSKPVTASNIECVLDVQSPPNQQHGRLRIWMIETLQDADGTDRFNNIQLTYRLDHSQARQIVARSAESPVTREDLSHLVHEPDNLLENLVLSSLTGKDKATGDQLGERYDLSHEEMQNFPEDLCNDLRQTITTVLGRLKQSAEAIVRHAEED
jgi:hypothetical protein